MDYTYDHPSVNTDKEWLSKATPLLTGYLQSNVPLNDNIGSLPPELWVQIVKGLDISSAVQFSRVSRWARLFTSKMFECHKMDEYATQCLFALIRTGLAAHLSVEAFYFVLTIKMCEVCPSLKDHLILPTLSRRCLICFQREQGDGVYLAVALDGDSVHGRQDRTDFPVLDAMPLGNLTDPTWVYQPLDRMTALKLLAPGRPWLQHIGPNVPYSEFLPKNPWRVYTSEVEPGGSFIEGVRGDDMSAWPSYHRGVSDQAVEELKDDEEYEYAETERHIDQYDQMDYTLSSQKRKHLPEDSVVSHIVPKMPRHNRGPGWVTPNPRMHEDEDPPFGKRRDLSDLQWWR